MSQRSRPVTDSRPIYQRLAASIRDQISSGLLPEGERAPSTNELSAFHTVNRPPAPRPSPCLWTKAS